MHDWTLQGSHAQAVVTKVGPISSANLFQDWVVVDMLFCTRGRSWELRLPIR